MRLVTVSQQNNKPYIAAVFYDRFVTQLTGTLGEENYLRTMVDFIRSGATTWNESYARAKIPTDTAVMLKKCKLHAPITPRSLRDFYAFEEHVKTAHANRGRDVPPEWYEVPVFYYSNNTNIYGTEEVIPYPSKSTALDYELEIACVIGKEGKDIPADKAEEYIFGYMIFNDWSARDIQKQEMAVGLGPAKGKDFASSFGPYLVTSDELAEYHAGRPGVYDLKMIARVNDKEYSRGNMKDMHWSFGDLIARASQDVTLYPGDVIASGTVGTGCLLELTKGEGPWLQPGDIVELEIEHLGVLRNIVGDRAGTTTIPRQTAEQIGVLLVTPVTEVSETPAEEPTPTGLAASTESTAAPVTTPASTLPSTQPLSQPVTSAIPAQSQEGTTEGATTLDADTDAGESAVTSSTASTSTPTSAPAIPPDTKPFDKSIVQSALQRAAIEHQAANSTQSEAASTNAAPQPAASNPDNTSSSDGASPAAETPIPASSTIQPAEQINQQPASSESAPAETTVASETSNTADTTPVETTLSEPTPTSTSTASPSESNAAEEKTPTTATTSTSTSNNDEKKGTSHE
jgi:fumarylacetoacetate (FAA) hydrolase